MRYFAIIAVQIALLSCAVHDRTPEKKEETQVNQPENPDGGKKPSNGSEVELIFKNAAEASGYLDLNSASSDCGKTECLFTDLEPELFTRNASAGYESTQAFIKKLTEFVPPLPRPEAIRVGEIKAIFDPAASIVFGAEDRLGELDLDKKCQVNFGLQNGQNLPQDSIVDRLIEESSENLDGAEISRKAIFGNLKITGNAQDGKVASGSEVSVGFQKLTLLGDMFATFKDFESISGKYKLPKEALAVSSTTQKIWASVKDLFQEAIAYAANFPEGYPVPPPANGYEYDPMHGTCNTNAPRITITKSYANLGEFCRSTGALCCETGRGCPTKWPFVTTDFSTGRPISDYVSRVRSRRVVSGAGTVDCISLFPSLAQFYGIGTGWTANAPNAQWFVKDAAWPGCGGYSCPDKTMRASADDSVAANVEPQYNYCLDRWLGLDYSNYLTSLQADCQNTDVYRKAVAAKAANDADQAFATACGGNTQCNNAIISLPMIRNQFPIEVLRKKIETEEKALASAKAENKTYMIQDPSFTKASIQKLADLIGMISKGLDKAEELRKSMTPNADWNGGGHRLHKSGTIQGFSSHSESQATIAEYEKLTTRINTMTAPSAIDVGCSFTGTGRFRQYTDSELKDISLKTADEPARVVKMKLLKDYKTE